MPEIDARTDYGRVAAVRTFVMGAGNRRDGKER